MTTPATEPVHDQESARQLVARLRHAVPLSAEPLLPALLTERLQQVAQALALFDFDAAQQAAARAGADITDVHALFQAGWELIEIGLDQFAVAPLSQALALDPNPGTALKLGAALSNSWCYREAADLFASYPGALDHSNRIRALYSHYSAMAGDFDAVTAVLSRITPDEEVATTLKTLATDRQARHQALVAVGRPHDGDLRGWELTLHGTVLLRVSEEGEDVMHGRFAALWESSDVFAETLAALTAVLADQHRVSRGLAFVPDHDSEILARTLATHLDLPTPRSIAETTQSDDMLVVAYRWSGEDPKAMLGWSKAPGVTLYGHILDWTKDCFLAPDIAGQEAQYVFAPWDNHMRAVPGPADSSGAPPQVEMIPPDTRPAWEIANDLAAKVDPANQSTETQEAVAEVAVLLDTLKQVGASCGLLTGQRHRFYPGGPVTSNRFF